MWETEKGSIFTASHRGPPTLALGLHTRLDALSTEKPIPETGVQTWEPGVHSAESGLLLLFCGSSCHPEM